MDRLWIFHPLLAGYRRFRGWHERRRYDCEVTINKPNIVVKGKLKNHKTNPHRFISFLGIPYAHPPVGELRFQPPQPLLREDFRRSYYVCRAYKLPQFCIEYHPQEEPHFKGSEDCLYLNVHIPHIPVPQQVLLPVFVFIHGGGYYKGNPSHLNLDHMVGEQKCVCVFIHCRLGPLGFLNMRTENCRGNAGLKDQVMALQWIKDNIQPFGGNPENVTICGQGSGGTCVNLHMISPLSRGLFHKAIVMSGGVYCTWDYGGRMKPLFVKRRFKWAIGKKKSVSRHVVVQMLKRQTADELLELNKIVTIGTRTMDSRKMTALFKPSVEYIPEDAFLPNRVERLMSAAEPVPTIAGITSQEGYRYFRAQPAGNRDPLTTVSSQTDFFMFLKNHLNWTAGSIRERFHALRDAYFPDLDRMKKDEIMENLAKLVTDIHFRRFYDNFKIGNPLKSGSHPFYVYLFDCWSGHFLLGTITHDPYYDKSYGSEHGDDLFYLLYKETVRRSLIGFRAYREKVQKSYIVISRMNELWASFCRDSEPKCLEGDVTWIPHTPDNSCYLRISEGLELRRERLNEERWQRFNDIFEGAVELQYDESEIGMLAAEDEN